MKTLETKEQFNELIEKEDVVFLFSAEWCADCRIIEPEIPSIEVDYPEYTFVYVDRDKFIEICQEQDIFGIPSFIAFREGKEAGRFVSKQRKTKEEIEEFLDGLEG